MALLRAQAGTATEHSPLIEDVSMGQPPFIRHGPLPTLIGGGSRGSRCQLRVLHIPSFPQLVVAVAPARPAQLCWMPSNDLQPTWRGRLVHPDWHNSWRVVPRCGKVRVSENGKV